ncbi:MAG: zinc ribbon domain-containing protein [Eubacteriales bacterium]|nr:zinc ribbon domain-containing protein [Eubacteriales bacterium]
MFCKKCGKELEDTARFCDSCGEKQQISSMPFNSENANAVLNDGKQIIKKFFSKNPGNALINAASSNSKIGVVLIAINVLLFAFVSCLNITQIINHMIKATTSVITSTTNSLLGDGLGNALTGKVIPDVEVPILYDLFFPFVLFALVIVAVVFAGIYIGFKLNKKPHKGAFTIANVVGVSGLPIATASAVNFILGFILPQFTTFVFLAAVLVSFVTLYEGVKSILGIDNALIAEFAILVLMVCIVLAIASQIAFAQVGEIVQNTIMNAAGDGLNSLSGILGNFF